MNPVESMGAPQQGVTADYTENMNGSWRSMDVITGGLMSGNALGATGNTVDSVCGRGRSMDVITGGFVSRVESGATRNTVDSLLLISNS